MNDRLSIALGAVREGAQAIDNLSHLLRARRVGPRAIAVALGEVREGCRELSAALSALETELCAELSLSHPRAPDAEGIARRLLSQGSACAAALASQLDMKGKADARTRLSLEDLARRSAAKFDAVIFLAELLAAAASQKVVPLDIGDALLELASVKGGAARVKVSVGLSGPRIFAGDARVVSGLLWLSIGRVARAASSNPSIAVTGSSDGGVEVRVSAGAGIVGDPETELLSLQIPLQEEMPMAGEVLKAATELAGVGLSEAEEPLCIALLFGKAGGAGP